MDQDQTKMLFIRAETHKMLALKANREYLDQTASQKQYTASQEHSDLGLLYLSRLLVQATTVRYFSTFTVPKSHMLAEKCEGGLSNTY